MIMPINLSLADICVLAAAFYLFIKKFRLEIQIDLPLLWLFVLYFLWVIIGLYAGIYKFNLQMSYLSFLIVIFKLWLLFIYFYVFINLVRNIDDLKVFLFASTIAGAINALLGIIGASAYQVFGIEGPFSIGFRATGTFGNANMFSAYMLISFFLTLIYFQLYRKRWEIFILLPVYILGLFLSASKGAMLAFLVCFITLLALSLRHHKKAFVIMILLLIVASLIIISSYNDSIYVNRFSTITSTQSFSARSRILLWDSAIKLWQKAPLMGVGTGNYAKISEVYNERWRLLQPQHRDILTQEGDEVADFIRVHSTYIALLCENGIIGLLLYLAFITFIFYRVVQSLITLDSTSIMYLTMICLGISLLGILMQAVVNNFENFRNMWCLTGVIYSASDFALNPKSSQACQFYHQE
jgi:O-antigen ligase